MNKILLLAILATLTLSACGGSSTIKLYGTAPSTTEHSTPTTSMDEFAQCLTDSGALMYGAYWCPHCSDQKKLFGDSVTFMPYVECEDEQARCSAAGIKGYPTWVIDGRHYEGGQSLAKLGSLTGCELPVES